MIDIVLLLIAISCFMCWLFDSLIKSKKHKEQQEKQREEFEQTFKIACKEFLEERGYLKVLVRKQKQLIMKDDYGDYIFDYWRKELRTFVESKMADFRNEWFNDTFVKFACEYGDDYEMRSLEFTHYLETVINTIIYEAKIEELQEETEFNTITDPIKYEHAICEVFTNCGWNAQVTKASGDQGVDVIAELNGVRVAVQCKLYSSPVGNGAVQEVFAAKSHYDCQLAMVVTNNSYTTSAKQLASTCGVELLHHDALIDWIADQA